MAPNHRSLTAILAATAVLAVTGMALTANGQSDSAATAPPGPLAAIDLTLVPHPVRAEIDACSSGDWDSCYALGDRYHGGDEVPRDNALSVHLIAWACERGSPVACVDLGARHYLGEYVNQDFTLAFDSFQRACEGGVERGCHMMGTMFERGIGVPADSDAAAHYFARGCALGMPQSCQAGATPGEAAGPVETALPETATQLMVNWARACDEGLMERCFLLAEAYGTGPLEVRDLEKAAELYAAACDWGFLPACR